MVFETLLVACVWMMFQQLSCCLDACDYSNAAAWLLLMFFAPSYVAGLRGRAGTTDSDSPGEGPAKTDE